MTLSSTDGVLQATHEAIERARRHKRPLVEPDDLLLGLLRSLARFGVVQIGDWTIDLETLDGQPSVAASEAGGSIEPRYSGATASIFDRAGRISREDGASGVSVLHLLVAFASESDGLMAQLRETIGFDSLAWRAALARMAAARDRSATNDGQRDEVGPRKELYSPDEAAELLGVHPQTVRGYIHSGKLTAFRLAGERAIRIKRSDLFDLLEAVNPEDAGSSDLESKRRT